MKEKEALATIFLLILFVSALSWLCIFVSAQASPTLTIGSRAGGSVIVQSSAINNGEAFTVLPGQEHS